MTVDIIQDMVTLTTISDRTLQKFFGKMMYCITEAVAEKIIENNEEDILELNIGIGTLYIKIKDKEPKYHFKPNELLAKSIMDVINGEDNSFTNMLNDAIVNKFTEVYKDLC